MTPTPKQETPSIKNFSELLRVHVIHLLDEGFTIEQIEQWIAEGLRSVTSEEALKLGCKTWVNGGWRSGSGIYFPFTPTFGQLRLDEPFKRKNGKLAKYITPYKKKTEAHSPTNCKVFTEGIKDAKAGTWQGGVPTGAIAGISHYKKALSENSGQMLLFDADGWINPQVFLNLFKGGLWLKGKVQLLPEIPGYPKAGLCEYFKAGYKAADYKELIANAMTPVELLMEWPRHWGKMPEKWITCAIKMTLKLGARYLDEIQRERLLNRVKTATKINISKLRFLLEREISIVNGKPQLKNLRPDELMNFVISKYRNRLKLNELGNVVELDGEPYDLDAAYIHLLMYRNLFATKYFVADVFKEVAKLNAFNPVKQYLDRTSKKVPPINIDNLSSRYFGTSNRLFDIFLKKTLISAVARAFNPGCKVDTTLVLQGDQGVGKSTFFQILGGEFFDDSLGDGRDKDDILKLHKCWIQEWGEVERVFSKRQAGEIKAFLSRSTDTFREPYGRAAKENKRHSIIVASVNQAQFLVDTTGNRRYWVIPISVSDLDLELLKKERDGIWAAAVAAYKAGERWWLTKEEANLSEDNNQSFQIVDEWESAIAEYTKFLDRTSVTEILVKCFDFEIGKMDRSSQMRVATILTFLGWKKVGIRSLAGKRQQCWERIPTDEQCENEITTSEVVTKVERAESTGISSKSQPHNLSQETFEISKNSSEEVVDPDPNEPGDNISEKSESEKDPDLGCEVVTCPSDQGFQESQPQTESKGCDRGDREENEKDTNSSENVNPVCDTFETETIKIKLQDNDANSNLAEPRSEERHTEAEEDERWAADIIAIAGLISDCKDLEAFREQFYPDGTESPWIPARQLNRAVKKLPIEKYEEIRNWVRAIKSDSAEPEFLQPEYEADLEPEPEYEPPEIFNQSDFIYLGDNIKRICNGETFLLSFLKQWSSEVFKKVWEVMAKFESQEKIEEMMDFLRNNLQERGDFLLPYKCFGEIENRQNPEDSVDGSSAEQLNLFEDDSTNEPPGGCRF